MLSISRMEKLLVFLNLFGHGHGRDQRFQLDELSLCLRRQDNVSMLRVRSHFLRHFSSKDVGNFNPSALRDALMNDKYLSTESIRDMLAGDIRLRMRGYHCRLGGVAMRLLNCIIVPISSSGCSASDLNDDLYLALGLADLGPLDILRSLWPMYALVAALVAHIWGKKDLDDDPTKQFRKLMSQSQLQGGQISVDAKMLAALTPVCPYREPFDFFFCGKEEIVFQEFWITTVFRFARLNMMLERKLGTTEARAIELCAGLQRTCLAASIDDELETHLTQAFTSLKYALEAVPHVPLLQHLTTEEWPVPSLLQQFENLALSGSRTPDLVSLSTHATSVSTLPSPCCCDLRSWRVKHARSIAAALRVLRQFYNVRGNPRKILDVAGSADAHAACPMYDDSRDEELPMWGVIVAAFQAMQLAWGQDLIHEVEASLDVSDEQMFHTWVRLLQDQDQNPDDFGPEVCMPGATALVLVCSVRILESRKTGREWSWWRSVLTVMQTLLTATGPCTDSLKGAASEQYLIDWESLALWHAGNLFLNEILQPLVESNLWWLGREIVDPPAQTVDESLSECHGLPDAVDCDASDRVVLRGSLPGLQTKILGVGLMKSGSTAIVQALRAATGFPLGMDCIAAKLFFDVQQGTEYIFRVFERCFEEVFKWELAKDPMLTPLAGRIAAAWPLMSNHRLLMYFVVRNPFAFIASFLKHLELTAGNGSSIASQTFSFGNWPNHERFNHVKQLYLDTQREGLKYSGYIDALAQRWVLSVDHFLRCPSRFVLVRYEDFESAPVETTRLLLWQLDLESVWSEEVAVRVRQVTSKRYQVLSDAVGGRLEDPISFFGQRMYARLATAVGSRVQLLGYKYMMANEAVDSADQPIDVPELPKLDCSM